MRGALHLLKASALAAVVLVSGILAAFAQTEPAQTGTQKVVAVVVDDSESMWNKAYLPGFGLQLLATALDPGRGDRLAVFSLNKGPICLGPFSDTWVSLKPEQWDVTRPCLAEAFEGLNNGTPYSDGIPPALDLLKENALAGIETHLVVFSDGQFDDLEIDDKGNYLDDEVADAYEEVQAELDRQRATGIPTGRIKVDFVAIGAERDGENGRLNQQMIKQKVRYNLLRVFNGDAQPRTCKQEQAVGPCRRGWANRPPQICGTRCAR